MFKQQKHYLGLKSFMLRTAKAIDRFLIILALACYFFICVGDKLVPLSSGIRRYRESLGNS